MTDQAKTPPKGSRAIEGTDFESANTLEAITRSLASTGFQASNLGRAIELVRQLVSRRNPVYLSFTGNIISSGLREVVAFLAKHRYVSAIVTTASGIEEDAIKAIGPFLLGSFETSGADLLERRQYRIGNIVAPQSLYDEFGAFLSPILASAHQRQQRDLPPASPSDLISEIGQALNDESSFLYWAARNDIPVYCPGITDGAIGDNLVTYSARHPGLCINVVRDHQRIVQHVCRQEDTTGAIVIGGGISKHYLLNASFFRGGFDVIVRISTALEQDGSDSGGNAEEAVSWRKLRPGGSYVSIFSEATLAFPMLVAATFAADFHATHRELENGRLQA